MLFPFLVGVVWCLSVRYNLATCDLSSGVSHKPRGDRMFHADVFVVQFAEGDIQ